MRRLVGLLLLCGCGGEITEPAPLKPCPIWALAVIWRDSIDQTTGNYVSSHAHLDTLTIFYYTTEHCLKVGEH